jgi:hypothetical protein
MSFPNEPCSHCPRRVRGLDAPCMGQQQGTSEFCALVDPSDARYQPEVVWRVCGYTRGDASAPEWLPLLPPENVYGFPQVADQVVEFRDEKKQVMKKRVSELTPEERERIGLKKGCGCK